MSVLPDSSKPVPANTGSRPFSRSDYESAYRVGEHPAPPRVPEPVPTITVDKIGDFLEIDFRRMFVWLRGGLLLAVVLAILGAIAGGAYGLLSKPLYTVGTDILINPANLQVVANDLYAQPNQGDNQAMAVQSKLRVLSSRNVLARVVDDLNLTSDTEFYDPQPGLIAGLLGTSSNAAAPDPKVAALENLSRRVDVKADETSFVATLSVSAGNIQKAILISQDIFKSFQDELAKAESDGASRAAGAIDDQLEQLKHDVQAADEKVEAYRRAHNLSSSEGQLVSTQSMTQLNTETVTAQSRMIAAQSAYDAVVAAGPNATSPDPAAASSLALLRAKVGNLQQQLDALSMTYGPRHPKLVQLRAEVAAAQSQIQQELARILASAKSSLDEAKTSYAALQGKVNDLKGNVFSDNEVQVALRELERDATSKTAVYESLLSRSHQIAERGQIDTTNVRVISTAVPPQRRSWPPRTAFIIVGGAVAGFMLGLFLAFVRGMMRDLWSSPQRVVVNDKRV